MWVIGLEHRHRVPHPVRPQCRGRWIDRRNERGRPRGSRHGGKRCRPSNSGRLGSWHGVWRLGGPTSCSAGADCIPTNMVTFARYNAAECGPAACRVRADSVLWRCTLDCIDHPVRSGGRLVDEFKPTRPRDRAADQYGRAARALGEISLECAKPRITSSK